MPDASLPCLGTADAAHDSLPPAARLCRVAGALAAGACVGDEDAAWLAAALNRYLAGARAGLSLEQALELATPGGGLPWWRVEAFAARDTLLRELAAGFTGPGTARANQLAHLLRRYAGTGWPHDRRGQPKAPSQQRRLLFDVFTLDPDPPLSVRRLYDIVTARDAVSAPCSLHTETGILGPVVETAGDAYGLS